MDKICVEAYAGYQADQEPTAVHLLGMRRRVQRITRRWREPDGNYFRVQLDGGRSCVLQHSYRQNRWRVISLT